MKSAPLSNESKYYKEKILKHEPRIKSIHPCTQIMDRGDYLGIQPTQCLKSKVLLELSNGGENLLMDGSREFLATNNQVVKGLPHPKIYHMLTHGTSKFECSLFSV